MIRVGMKISSADWREKIETNPDFVEIVLREDGLNDQKKLIHDMKKRDMPWFGHLPTTYKEGDEIFLLNFASVNKAVRDRSRNLLAGLVEELGKESHPEGWIVHTPTAWNFSTKGKLFDKGDKTEFQDTAQWLSFQVNNALVENVPPALKWEGNVYHTDPFDMQADRHVLDTGHLYASTRSDEQFLDEFTLRSEATDYFHLASLTCNEPYDSHGRLFSADQEEYPDSELLRQVLSKIAELKMKSTQDVYLVCEPGGDTALHIENIAKLRQALSEITS